ncbi:MAG: DUF4197 domain-containing protein [Saprospiraceae bacterium]|nr:DUF4197 domain-containing protein [Saprospiraceae bacterium]
MKYISLLLSLLIFTSCDPKDLNKILDNAGSNILSDADITTGLKEALNLGVDKSVATLSTQNGYYNSVYKILLPPEAAKVTSKLRSVPGFTNLEEEAIKKINRAAEDAASKAGPIFLDAIRKITFTDVKNILMGDKDAATQYLRRATYTALYGEFKPVMVTSLNTFGALDYYADAVNTYNKIPFVEKVNADLADYVANKALDGLFDLVKQKELGIRSDISQRTSSLLRKVFARQD